ncbi:uncharacterized protein LOC124454503 [Xenia sp. Carnegie-2017]|uniref:uncharacterized protein LOC124454503 n=1 Tax=Xenia sp. Carnegie-2017 TaxID=2897299 RepID=UPI001F04A712|nr:uncharacterized protein LOC124454503 [Xenia sp. Carnegie-2017]
MCFANSSRHKLHEITQETPQETQDGVENYDEIFLGELNKPNGNEILTGIKVNNKVISFKIDTGAQCNIMPLNVFTSLNDKPTLHQTNTKIKAYGGTQVRIRGKCYKNIEHNNKKIHSEFYVVEIDNSKPLIGLQTCRDLDLISINDVCEIHQAEQNIFVEYQDVFKGIVLVNGQYHIEIKSDAKPTIHPSRKVPLSLMPRLKSTLENLTETGIISKVDRATDWVNSLVIVEKRNGLLRLCLDPKHLNQAIKREYYNPPSAEEISNKLNGTELFTVIDMTSCYWHKKLDEESSYLCTFNTPFGRYKFNRMLFGICSASDVAQKMVDE